MAQNAASRNAVKEQHFRITGEAKAMNFGRGCLQFGHTLHHVFTLLDIACFMASPTFRSVSTGWRRFRAEDFNPTVLAGRLVQQELLE